MPKTSRGIYYELHGRGKPLILGYTVTASVTSDDPTGEITFRYIAQLSDRYRVLVMDYPNLGQSEPIPARDLTADRVCKDLLEVAGAAGFDDFIWWGYSWGGVVGLQLASRSDRIAALVCGGWPPLGGPYSEVLQATRAMAADAPPNVAEEIKQYTTFYESIRHWPESDAVKRISCPRMAFFGSSDEVELAAVKVPIAARFRERRLELEQSGWDVAEIPGRDHSLWTDPNTVVPIVRKFLDART